MQKILTKFLIYFKKLYISVYNERSLKTMPPTAHLTYDIVFYMSGGEDTKYQYDVWGPIIRELALEGIKVLTVFRGPITWSNFSDYGDDKILVTSLEELIDTYSRFSIRVILYPNNRMKNFQSLSYNPATHIFINHGESEKSSMYSNQAKAYDYVFVAGEMARDRYIRYVTNIDKSKLIKVGRPQLDFVDRVNFTVPENKKVVLYAPTWEGTHHEMNYSSISDRAYQMVKNIIDQKDCFLIYKPHPNLGTNSKYHRNFHHKIEELVRSSSNSRALFNVDINSLFPVVDFAIFDNSSVIIDYLVTEKPYVIINKFYVDQSEELPVIAQGNNILVEQDDMPSLSSKIDYIVSHHDLKQAKKNKKLYLGDFAYRQSTKEFINEVKKCLSLN